MNNQWSSQIDKLMLWRANGWVKFDSTIGSHLALRIYYNQLMITSNTKILENFDMNSRIKGIFKDDILILIVNTGQLRKLKFQIKADVAQCLFKLGEHFPVMNHNSFQSKNTIQSKYRNVDEVLKQALDSQESTISKPMPLEYGNFIKCCLLDPTFPQIVLETNRVLQNEVLKK